MRPRCSYSCDELSTVYNTPYIQLIFLTSTHSLFSKLLQHATCGKLRQYLEGLDHYLLLSRRSPSFSGPGVAEPYPPLLPHHPCCFQQLPLQRPPQLDCARIFFQACRTSKPLPTASPAPVQLVAGGLYMKVSRHTSFLPHTRSLPFAEWQ